MKEEKYGKNRSSGTWRCRSVHPHSLIHGSSQRAKDLLVSAIHMVNDTKCGYPHAFGEIWWSLACSCGLSVVGCAITTTTTTTTTCGPGCLTCALRHHTAGRLKILSPRSWHRPHRDSAQAVSLYSYTVRYQGHVSGHQRQAVLRNEENWLRAPIALVLLSGCNTTAHVFLVDFRNRK